MKILVTGDLFSGGDIITENVKPQISSRSFKNSDIRIVNLENPLSDSHIYVQKSVLFAPVKPSLDLLNNLKIDYCSLANNHMHDKGSDGFADTVGALASINIKSFGAGTSLANARKPAKLTDNLYIFAYCQFDAPTLNNIQLAGENTAGVNPLILEGLFEDLDLLPVDSEAILFLHWGREHVWLTDYENITLAKKILSHPKVKAIIGSHPHRPQPVFKHNGKFCYFCLGNFLFPNFFIAPPKKITYDKPEKYLATKRYHSVSAVTYKKWKLVNRISLGVQYCTEADKFKTIFFYQSNNTPVVKELAGLAKLGVKMWLELLTLFFLFPGYIYKPLQKIQVKAFTLQWLAGIAIFKIRQDGAGKVLKRFLK